MNSIMRNKDEMGIEEQSIRDLSLSASAKNLRDCNLLDLGRQLLAEAKLGNGEKIKKLVAAGAPFTADWVGTSPIHWTAHYNYIEVTELLLKSGISPDARNKVDRTPLHVACQKGHVEIVRLLIAFGADINARDMIRMSPLHWSALSGQKEIVQMLLDHGAAIQPLSKFGKTPAEIAEDHSYYDIIKVIEETKALPPLERTIRVTLKRKESSLIGQRLKLDENGTNTPQGTGEVLKMVAKRRKIGIIVNKNGENGKIEVIDEEKQNNSSPSNGLTNNKEQAIKTLKEHGITMLEPDDGTVVSSAVQGGQSIKLTEAGKLALSSSKPSLTSTTTTITTTSSTIVSTKPLPKASPSIISAKSPVKLLSNGQKIITIKADQLINMTKEKKVIIKQARPVPNARIFDGKLYTIAQKDELVKKIKEKRSETETSLKEKKKCFDEKRKVFEEIKDYLFQTKKEIEELQKKILNYDQTLSKMS